MKATSSIRRLLLGILVASQLAVPLIMIRGREIILREGEVFRFITEPIDPIDAFRGRFIRLGIKDNYIRGTPADFEDLDPQQPIFATISTNTDGFAFFSEWSDSPSASAPYLKTKTLGEARIQKDEIWVYSGVRIHVPFDRFYMDEVKAPAAEKLVAQPNDDEQCWVQVRVLNGKAAIENVFVNGQAISEFVESRE